MELSRDGRRWTAPGDGGKNASRQSGGDGHSSSELRLLRCGKRTRWPRAATEPGELMSCVDGEERTEGGEARLDARNSCLWRFGGEARAFSG